MVRTHDTNNSQRANFIQRKADLLAHHDQIQRRDRIRAVGPITVRQTIDRGQKPAPS